MKTEKLKPQKAFFEIRLPTNASKPNPFIKGEEAMIEIDKPWPDPPKELLEEPTTTSPPGSFIKPWTFIDGKSSKHAQDDPKYWNQPDILISDTGRATVEQAKQDPMFGWDDWTPDGMMSTIDSFCIEYDVPLGACVLEIGCGGGKQMWAWHHYKSLHESIGCIMGIDHAPGVIDVARARMPQGAFYCASADDKVSLEAKLDMGYFDVICTLTCLQHNSSYKLRKIFKNIHELLSPDGLLWIINELTIDSKNYVSTYHPQTVMSPWVTDERGSHGTAAWWIGFIADYGFELLSFKKSSYVFRKI